MTDQACRGCRHWTQGDVSIPLSDPQVPSVAWHVNRPAWEADLARREEAARLLEQQYGVCGGVEPRWYHSWSGEDPPRAFTIDGSDYLAELVTHETFGCVLWASVVPAQAADA